MPPPLNQLGHIQAGRTPKEEQSVIVTRWLADRRLEAYWVLLVVSSSNYDGQMF